MWPRKRTARSVILTNKEILLILIILFNSAPAMQTFELFANGTRNGKPAKKLDRKYGQKSRNMPSRKVVWWWVAIKPPPAQSAAARLIGKRYVHES